MAQKKLLFPVILLLLSSTVILGAEQPKFEFKQVDLNHAKHIAEQGFKFTMPQIKAKWFELQAMLAGHRNDNSQNHQHDSSNQIQPNQDLLNSALTNQDPSMNDANMGTSLRIFVSSSMNHNLLKRYAQMAKKYEATLVFNGLPDGSWRKLSELIMVLSGNEPDSVRVQLDDEAFKDLNIQEVPTFVLAKEASFDLSKQAKIIFDKVAGAIGIRQALEIFAEEGELQAIAKAKLEALVKDE